MCRIGFGHVLTRYLLAFFFFGFISFLFVSTYLFFFITVLGLGHPYPTDTHISLSCYPQASSPALSAYLSPHIQLDLNARPSQSTPHTVVPFALVLILFFPPSSCFDICQTISSYPSYPCLHSRPRPCFYAYTICSFISRFKHFNASAGHFSCPIFAFLFFLWRAPCNNNKCTIII
jgi:hypothetical protein